MSFGQPAATPTQIFRAAVGRVWALVIILVAIIFVGEALLSWRANATIVSLRMRESDVQNACRALQGAAPLLLGDVSALSLTRDPGVVTTLTANRDRARMSLIVLRQAVVSGQGPGLVETIAVRMDRLIGGIDQQGTLMQTGSGVDRTWLVTSRVDLDDVLGLINQLVAAEQAAVDAQVADVQQQRLIGLLIAGLLLAVVSVSSARRLRHGQRDLAEAQRQLDEARATAESAAARAERLLADMQAAEASYRTVFEGIDDAIVIADASGRFIDANPATTALLGYSRAELLSMSVGHLSADSAAGRERFAILQREGRWRGDVDLVRKDGGIVPAEGWQVRIGASGSDVFVAVWRDISERRALEGLQRDFLAMVTHELKSPLTTISAYAQYMRRREAYNTPAITAIVAQAQRLNRLIDDLLDVSRIDAGRLELRREMVDVGAMLAAAADHARLLAPPHPVTVDVPPQPIEVWCDRDQIMQVLMNLLSNAVKYSPEGAPIVLRLEVMNESVRISVRDQGIGIASEEAARLFDRFYRSADARERGTPGLGLGLAITRGLVETHGGSIEVASIVGVGSTFTVTLPIDARPSNSPPSSLEATEPDIMV